MGALQNFEQLEGPKIRFRFLVNLEYFFEKLAFFLKESLRSENPNLGPFFEPFSAAALGSFSTVFQLVWALP